MYILDKKKSPRISEGFRFLIFFLSDQNHNFILQNLNQASFDFEAFRFSGSFDIQCSFAQIRDQRCVVFQNLKAAINSGQGQYISSTAKQGFVRCKNFNVHDYALASSSIFWPLAMASSIVPTRLKAASGY